MKTFLVLLFLSPLIVYLIFRLYNKLTFRFYDPYYVESFFGLPGCGKTTDACKLAIKVQKKKTYYDRMYCNFDCPGTFKFDLQELIKINKNRSESDLIIPFETNSIVCIDEAGLEMNSRNFRDFSFFLQVLFRKVRHFKIYLRIYSQAFDTDKTVRNLSRSVYIMKKYLRVFTIVREVVKDFDIGTDIEGNGSLVENYHYRLLPKINFIPRYIDLFDSHEVKSSVFDLGFNFHPFPETLSYCSGFFRFVGHSLYIWFLNRIFKVCKLLNLIHDRIFIRLTSRRALT